jgi:hypothetical protein
MYQYLPRQGFFFLFFYPKMPIKFKRVSEIIVFPHFEGWFVKLLVNLTLSELPTEPARVHRIGAFEGVG